MCMVCKEKPQMQTSSGLEQLAKESEEAKLRIKEYPAVYTEVKKYVNETL